MSDLRLILTRDRPDRERTFGILSEFGGDDLCNTLEPGTADRDYPRVPTGFYVLERHESARYGDTVALVGAQVAHYDTPGIDRSAILIHAGNRDDHTRGCILVGETRGQLDGEPSVIHSRRALERVLGRIREASRAYLVIR